MDPAAIVNNAAQCFIKRADAPFVACFDEAVTVYWGPALSQRPIMSSRGALEAWLARTREMHPELDVSIADPVVHRDGVVCDLIVVDDAAPADVWRVALAMRVDGGLIREVRAFWGRETAVNWLVNFE